MYLAHRTCCPSSEPDSRWKEERLYKAVWGLALYVYSQTAANSFVKVQVALLYINNRKYLLVFNLLKSIQTIIQIMSIVLDFDVYMTSKMFSSVLPPAIQFFDKVWFLKKVQLYWIFAGFWHICGGSPSHLTLPPSPLQVLLCQDWSSWQGIIN